MTSDDSRRTDSDSEQRNSANDDASFSRRGALKTIGASMVGGVGVASTSVPVAATDYNYITKETDDGVAEDDITCGGAYVKLSVGTELGHWTGTTSNGIHQAFLHFTSAGGVVDSNGDGVNAITLHEFTLDGCDDAMETLIDTNDTGVYPADSTETNNDFKDLAETAVSAASTHIGLAMTALETAKEIDDIFTNKDENCSSYTKTWKANRHKSWDMAKEAEATTQGDFKIEWPVGESGWVSVDTSMTASRSAWCNGSTSYSSATVTNHFDIYCDSNGSDGFDLYIYK